MGDYSTAIVATIVVTVVLTGAVVFALMPVSYTHLTLPTS